MRLKTLTNKWDKKLTNFKNLSTVSNAQAVTCGHWAVMVRLTILLGLSQSKQWPHSQLSARRVVYTDELQNRPEISWFE